MVSNVGRSIEDFSIPTSQRAVSDDLGQADFLKLMVEQMRNQNPLDPQDNGEFFSQIAQFQTLDAMNVISDAITTLVEISGLSNASSLIGRSIVAEVPQRPDPATGFPRPAEDVSGVVERVTFDSNGAVLHVGELAIPASMVVEISGSLNAPAIGLLGDPLGNPVTQTPADVTAELFAQLEALGAFGLDAFGLGPFGLGGEASGTDGEPVADGDADAVAEPEAAAEEPAVDDSTGDVPAGAVPAGDEATGEASG